MTEHSKIPLPGQPEADEEASLLERAVRAFDLGKLAPPPVPSSLAPPVIKPAQRNRPVRKAAVEETPAPQHEEIFSALVEAEPEPAPPAPAPAPVPAAKAESEPAPEPEIEPVRFRPVHHAVDRNRLRDQGMIVPEGSVTALLEEFRIVKRQLLLHASELRQQGGGMASQRVLVCSPHPGEGKTYSSVNLALSIAAEKDSEVLLVDADFAKPSVLTTLGLPGGPGLMDALVDPAIDVADCVLGTDIPGLWVLPAGNATNSDSEFLSSKRTPAILDRLTQGAPQRIVIFDSPPALAASPAAELAKYVGQALVVVRADRTGQGALEDAISLLSACPNIQLLLNAVHFSPSGRRFGSYYGYGG